MLYLYSLQINKNFFKVLQNVRLKWTVLENGIEKQQGTINNIKIAAQESKNYKLQLSFFSEEKEYVLIVQLLCNQKEGLLNANHEIAFEQFILTEYTPQPSISSTHADLKIETDKNYFIIENDVGKMDRVSERGTPLSPLQGGAGAI